jgi:hypothetical protein
MGIILNISLGGPSSIWMRGPNCGDAEFLKQKLNINPKFLHQSFKI